MQLKIINKFLAFGIVGEFYTNQPQRTRGYYIESLGDNNANAETKNIIGRVLFHHKTKENVVGINKTTDNGAVAGILGFPKYYVRPQLTNIPYIPNNQSVEMIQQGYVVVNLLGLAKEAFTPAATADQSVASIGDHVYYHEETGQLVSASPDLKFKKANNKYHRLQGATVAIQNFPLVKEKESIAVIYIDIAGDNTESIEA